MHQNKHIFWRPSFDYSILLRLMPLCNWMGLKIMGLPGNLFRMEALGGHLTSGRPHHHSLRPITISACLRLHLELLPAMDSLRDPPLPPIQLVAMVQVVLPRAQHHPLLLPLSRLGYDLPVGSFPMRVQILLQRLPRYHPSTSDLQCPVPLFPRTGTHLQIAYQSIGHPKIPQHHGHPPLLLLPEPRRLQCLGPLRNATGPSALTVAVVESKTLGFPSLTLEIKQRWTV
jgi:hypothetical protein